MAAALRNFGEAHLSAADGVVAHEYSCSVSDHSGRFAATLPHEEGNTIRFAVLHFCELHGRRGERRPRIGLHIGLQINGGFIVMVGEWR